MRHSHPVFLFVLALALAVVTLNCPPKPPPETVPEPPAQPVEEPAERAPVAEAPAEEVTESFPSQPVDTGPAVEPTVEELNELGVLRTVYFEFDKYELDEVARATLQANAEWLAGNPDRKIRVEGHCDERGTLEYNLALGEKRASAVRDYLVSLGIKAARIRIVSFGEERPVDPGHDEDAWAKNRRGQFVIES